MAFNKRVEEAKRPVLVSATENFGWTTLLALWRNPFTSASYFVGGGVTGPRANRHRPPNASHHAGFHALRKREEADVNTQECVIPFLAASNPQ